jgi:predicted 3-demethylubiquinone-9 3-methyltransferase (glyoxalase superfamily)
MTPELSIRTCLWFERGGLEAARRYVELIPNSRLETGENAGPEPLIVSFSLNDVPYMILNGGPRYQLSPAASIVVITPDQAETDRLWGALLEGGGEESRCGWLIDRFGVSWQIVPEALPRLMGDPDRAAAERAIAAMLKMSKIDIATLEAAFHDRA